MSIFKQVSRFIFLSMNSKAQNNRAAKFQSGSTENANPPWNAEIIYHRCVAEPAPLLAGASITRPRAPPPRWATQPQILKGNERTRNKSSADGLVSLRVVTGVVNQKPVEITFLFVFQHYKEYSNSITPKGSERPPKPTGILPGAFMCLDVFKGRGGGD